MHVDDDDRARAGNRVDIMLGDEVVEGFALAFEHPACNFTCSFKSFLLLPLHGQLFRAYQSVPLPQSRTIRGGPSNALNMTVMRPFSCRCAIVSTPLPERSRYQNVLLSILYHRP